MLIRPQLSSGAPQGEERIRLGLETALRRVVSLVPVEQRVVLGRDRRARGRHLGPSPGLVRRVPRAIETPAVRSRLDKHQIAARVRRAVGHTVQDGVDVHARAQLRGEPLLARPLYDLGHREVSPVRVLSMKEGGHQPYLIGHLQLMPRSEEHTSELQSHVNIVCRLLLEKKKKKKKQHYTRKKRKHNTTNKL